VILVDTSVWIDHFRRSDARLVEALTAGGVLSHPHVVGELCLGDLKAREIVVAMLVNLPKAILASDEEVLGMIIARGLAGRGIGYTDTHLLASTMLTPGARLWTRDRRLEAVTHDMGVAFIA
jgi:predicted nucleic acid-binding protein